MVSPAVRRLIDRRLVAPVKSQIRRWVEGDSVRYIDDDRRIDVGPYTWAASRLVETAPDDGEAVRIGKFCALNDRAAIMHGGHHRADWVGSLNVEWENGHPLPRLVAGVPTSRGPVVIGNDVWVSYEALILSGVTIGDGAVIGARAVVTKNVEPYEVVAGNPARHIRYRFDEPTRAALLRIRWWDWPHEKLARCMHEINSDDVAGFIARHDPEPPT